MTASPLGPRRTVIMAIAAAAVTAGTPAPSRIALVRQLPGSPWAEYRAQGTRPVHLFVVRDDRPKPVVLLLQGSGCVPLFTVDGDGSFHGTTVFDDLIEARAARFHFVIVEKPGVEPLRFAPGMTREQKLALFRRTEQGACSQSYVKNETKDVRVEDAQTVIGALAGESWARGILVAGHSEGTQVTTGLLRRDSTRRIRAAALLSSAGPTQFYGELLAAGGTREAMQRTFETMQRLQRSGDDEMYQGHPARRWKTYALNSTPLEDVRESTTPLFVAHGEREKDLLKADLFVLEALRQQPTRPLRYVVVADGDHAFATSDGRDRIGAVLDDFLSWALDSERRTSMAILK